MKRKLLYIVGIGIATFVILLLILYLRPSQLISREEAVKKIQQPHSKFYNWNGSSIHYVDQGKGPVIIMIHGLGGSHRNFEKLALALQDSFRVIRIDLPGFGLSEFPKEQHDYKKVYENCLADLIQTLQLDSVTLIGNSMGGMVAWNYCAHTPDAVRNLILMGSAGYDLAAARKQAVSIASLPLAEKIVSKGVPLWITQQGVKRCYYNDNIINPIEVEKANVFWNTKGNLDQFFRLIHSNDFPDENDIKNIKTPTLIIWGENDEIAPLKNAYRFQKDIIGSTLKVYPRCGHMPQNECTQVLASDIKIFISKK